MALLGTAAMAAYLAYASRPQSREILRSGQPFYHTPVPGHSTRDLEDTRMDSGEMPVQLGELEPRQAEPPSLPWDSVGNDNLFAQGDRSIQMNRPILYFPPRAVEAEPPKHQRNPEYPDDLRAYDTMRSRVQKTLTSATNRNFQSDRHHIPYQPRHATRQEVAQNTNLAGRNYSVYTSGSQDRNGVIINIKDPSGQVVRRRANHIDDDRSTYFTHVKKQHGEFIGNVIQDAVATHAVESNPTEHVYVTKARAVPRYLNPFENLHGFTRLSARQQRGDIENMQTLKKRKVLLVGDQGHVSSQVSHGGYDNALITAPTVRRREILPSLEMPGLHSGGTGRTFTDLNTGNENNTLLGGYGQVQTREKLVSALTPYTHTIGVHSVPYQHTYVAGQDDSRDVRNDSIRQYRPTQAFYAPANVVSQSDVAHSIAVPLVR